MSPDELLGLVQTACDRASDDRLTLRLDQHIVDELALDSLQQMEILSDLEQALEIEIVGDKRLHDVTTVGDLVELLAELTTRDTAPRGEERAAAAGAADTP
jgi:acyl carrier protein